MHKIYNLIPGYTNEKLQEKAAYDATFQAFKTARYLIGFLTILNNICFSNQSEQNPIRSLCLSTRRLYNTIQYASYNTTNYLVRFRNTQTVNESCNGIQITRGVQEHGMKILFPLHTTGFYALHNSDKKEAETSVEELLCAILYLENSDKDIFYDLKKHVENNYVLNKSQYPRTATAVQSLILNYQPNYNYNSKYQSNGVINKLMFAQNGKTGDDVGETKY